MTVELESRKGEESQLEDEDELAVETEDDKPSDYECGLGAWKPKWLQRFATSKAFMTVYGTLGTVQAMAFIYFISTLTTIERRFGIQSKTTGWMLSGNEVSQILLSPLLSFYGGTRNRPLWIAWGVAFSAISCYVLASPHFLFGPGIQALTFTKEFKDKFSHMNTSFIERREKLGLCSGAAMGKECEEEENEAEWAPVLIFLSQFILGIGTTLYYSLGQPYIDDNSKKASTPILLGLSMALRTIGPTFAFLVSYLCLSTYIDPRLTPTIGRKDPRWLGAWWLGWVILGSVMFLQAILIAFFPKKLKKKTPEKVLKIQHPAEEPLQEKNKVKKSEVQKNDIQRNGKKTFYIDEDEVLPKPTKTKDFLPSLIKIMKNKLLVINIFAGIFYILGASGDMTYMTKNNEIQFYQTAANANIILGPVILSSMVTAFIISGYAISKFKPRPTYLLGWNVVVGIFYVITQISKIFIACPGIEIEGYDPVTKSFDLINDCNSHCGCDGAKFSPVCAQDIELTFFTPCHAGCSTRISTSYANCSCIPMNSSVTIPTIPKDDYGSYKYETYGGNVTDGYCLPECTLIFTGYIILSCLKNFLGCTGKIGNVLVNYRAVDPHEKSFAAGIALFLVSLLAFIPGPVIFGYIIDSTCLLWDNSCGREGNCWFYDRDAFRLYLNGTSAVFTFTAVILDSIVCYLGRNLSLYDEEEPRDKRKEILKNDCERLQSITPIKENS